MTEIAPRDTIPAASLWLGIAGVLPFAGCAVQIATGWPLGPRLTGPALYLLLTYAAVILSFLGGVQWGLAAAVGSNDLRRFGAGIAPSLLAWLALWIGARIGVIVLALGFAVQFGYDYWTVARGEAPGWYGRLRLGLSIAVLACLAVSLLLGPF